MQLRENTRYRKTKMAREIAANQPAGICQIVYEQMARGFDGTTGKHENTAFQFPLNSFTIHNSYTGDTPVFGI